MDSCVRGLANTVNLRSCTWTREGSLTPDILLTILKHPSLQELAINGGNYGNYDPKILAQFISLRRIDLIMPSSPVIEVLPMWLKSLANPLQSLTIVCRVGATLDVHPTKMLNPGQRRALLSSQMNSSNECLKICPVSMNLTC